MNGDTTIQLLNVQHGCCVPVYPETKTKTYFLPVAGALGRGRELHGYLVSNPADPTKAKLYAGTPHNNGTNWWIGFSGIPSAVAATDPPAEYVLIVTEEHDPLAEKLAVAVKIRIAAPPFLAAVPAVAAVPAAPDFTIYVDTPPAVLCPQQFNVSGQYVNPSLIGGTIAGVTGTLVYFDPNGTSWVLQFTNVPPSNGGTYTLAVVASDPANPNSPATKYVANLAVAASGCNPIIPSTTGVGVGGP